MHRLSGAVNVAKDLPSFFDGHKMMKRAMFCKNSVRKLKNKHPEFNRKTIAEMDAKIKEIRAYSDEIGRQYRWVRDVCIET